MVKVVFFIGAKIEIIGYPYAIKIRLPIMSKKYDAAYHRHLL